MQNENVTVKLSGLTVFPDLNKAEGKEADYARDSVSVSRLKYKHFRQMQHLDDAQQMQYAISALTGLTEADMDELYAEDAAEITSVIYGFMQKYLNLAKKMIGDVSAA
ncbi:MAG: hypothetical protein ACYCQI_10345 [Gammaproteobacteria bacterium]